MDMREKTESVHRAVRFGVANMKTNMIVDLDVLEHLFTHRRVLLELIGSLTLCDHMGDAADDINKALKMIGLKIEWDDLSDLGTKLGKMGVTTLWGTSLAD